MAAMLEGRKGLIVGIANERSIAWDDPTIAIDWPLAALGLAEPLLSGKDRAGVTLAQAELPA